MTKILFICHGNICRSASAEFVMKEIVRREGVSDRFFIESKGTSAEELGNGMYPPMYKELKKHGIDGGGRHLICFGYDEPEKAAVIFDLIEELN